MFNRFNGNKVRTQCQLCGARIKLQRNKRQQQLKGLRKEVAELLKTNRQENARIRVENIIREQLMLQAFETLELFLEQLSVRTKQIEASREIPADMLEALSSLVYASDRIGRELEELMKIRVHIAQKFGREFVQESASDVTCRKWHVNENLIKCLAVDPPPPEEKLAMLSEVAQEFGVEWDAKRAADEMLPLDRPTFPSYGMPGGPGASVPDAWSLPSDAASDAGSIPYSAGVAAGFPPPVSSFKQEPGLPGGTNLGVPGTSQGSAWGDSPYTDAMSAAAAAKKYSEEARIAAEAAQRYASGSSGTPGAGGGGGGAGGGGGTPLHLGTTPGPNGGYNSGGSSSSFPAIVHDSAATVAPPEPGLSRGSAPVSSISGSAGDAVAGPPVFGRSESAIQREYDAAPGPPSKSDAKPSAPPQSPPTSLSPSQSAPALDSPSGGSGDFGLPAPPRRGVPAPPTAPGPATAPAPASPKRINELDELTKRFEALKRGDMI